MLGAGRPSAVFSTLLRSCINGYEVLTNWRIFKVIEVHDLPAPLSLGHAGLPHPRFVVPLPVRPQSSNMLQPAVPGTSHYTCPRMSTPPTRHCPTHTILSGGCRLPSLRRPTVQQNPTSWTQHFIFPTRSQWFTWDTKLWQMLKVILFSGWRLQMGMLTCYAKLSDTLTISCQWSVLNIQFGECKWFNCITLRIVSDYMWQSTDSRSNLSIESGLSLSNVDEIHCLFCI
jgi:hypothetical protein